MMAETQGILVIISSPSGGGKTTVVDRLLKRHDDWVRSVSVTTRAPRSGEKDSVDYFFVGAKEFEAMKTRGDLLESATVFDNSYGTPKKFVLENIRAGRNVLLAIDVQGAKQIARVLEKDVPSLSIFIIPPSVKVLRERLENRKTDSAEQIEKRLKMAQSEIKEAGVYDHSVMNQNLEQTVGDIEQLIEGYNKIVKQGGES